MNSDLNFVASAKKTVTGLFADRGQKIWLMVVAQIARVEKRGDCQLDCQTRGLWHISADGVDD
jgi:hypothetical protein